MLLKCCFLDFQILLSILHILINFNVFLIIFRGVMRSNTLNAGAWRGLIFAIIRRLFASTVIPWSAAIITCQGDFLDASRFCPLRRVNEDGRRWEISPGPFLSLSNSVLRRNCIAMRCELPIWRQRDIDAVLVGTSSSWKVHYNDWWLMLAWTSNFNLTIRFNQDSKNQCEAFDADCHKPG
jgi:hypothetical protein